ncbi:MAG: WD40 domain-containing protein, partial [Phormidesmis sp. CAN_BIN44]|nr:WD40 domain-containing protein [Phormidesmis sp. CAN_BIN44]
GTLTEHTNSVNVVAISSDGQRFASGSSDNTIKVWQLT